jgi:hypothetical protein
MSWDKRHVHFDLLLSSTVKLLSLLRINENRICLLELQIGLSIRYPSGGL